MIDLRLVELNLMFDEIFVLKDDLRFMKKKKKYKPCITY